MEKSFIEYMQDNGLSENTYKSYFNDIETFKKYYFDSTGEQLQNLIHADIKMYKEYLYRNNFATVSINRKMAALKQYNLYLVENNIQKNIVVLDKDYIKIQKSIIKKDIPSQQEIEKLLYAALKNPKNALRDYCIICLFVYCGLRESELISLRIVDVKIDEHFLYILGKGGKSRQIIINRITYNAIKDYLEEREKLATKNPYFFISQKNMSNEKHYDRSFCNKLLDYYSEITGIKNLHPHKLRAYFCTNALHNASYTIDQVANQASHSSLNTTKSYLINDNENLLDLANKL